MGEITRQTASELRRLPLTLAKLAGGILAVVGLPGAIGVLTRSTRPSWPMASVLAVVGVAGILIFVAASRAITKRADTQADAPPTTKGRRLMNVVAWTVLFTLAVAFVLATWWAAS